MTDPNRFALEFDHYRVPCEIDLLYFGQQVVRLQPRAVRLLRYLALNSDRVVPKNELLETVWPDVFTTDGVLKKAIARIRRALGDDATSPRFIRTHHKRGYRFVAPVRTATSTVGTRQRESRRKPEELTPRYDHFAGREAQLATLRAELANALGTSVTCPVVVTGEAGIGKTSLARRFGQWAQGEGIAISQGRLLPRGRTTADRSDPMVELLRQASGSDLPDTLVREALPIARAWLEISCDRPRLLILDDLHRADERSLEIIGTIMRLIDTEPLMILLLVRSEEDGPIRSWLAEHALQHSYTMLELRGLDRDDCREIVGSAFNARRSGEIPPRDIDHLHELTGGNPHFLLETLRVLVADGLVRPDRANRRWIWDGIRGLNLPGSIVTASRARIESLSPRVAALMECASVIGNEFPVALLSHLSGLEATDVENLLEEALASGLVSIAVSPRDDYRFHHPVLRRVVYEAIPPQKKRHLHRRVADAIQALHSNELDLVARSLSEHCAAAGDDRSTFDYSLRAWDTARSQSEWLDSLSLVERAATASEALERAGALSAEERLALRLAQGETSLSLGHLAAATASLTMAEVSSRSTNDRPLRARALLLLGRVQVARSDHAAASRSFREALELFTELGDRERSSRVVLRLAGAEDELGNHDAVDQLIREALTTDQSEELAALAHGVLGWSYAKRGNTFDGRRLLGEAIEFYDHSNDRLERAALLRRLHSVQLSLGEHDAAIETATRAREESIAIGDARGEAQANLGIGQVRVSQGLIGEGISYLQRALERLESIGDLERQSREFWSLGRAKVASGDLESASTLILRAAESLSPDANHQRRSA